MCYRAQIIVGQVSGRTGQQHFHKTKVIFNIQVPKQDKSYKKPTRALEVLDPVMIDQTLVSISRYDERLFVLYIKETVSPLKVLYDIETSKSSNITDPERKTSC